MGVFGCLVTAIASLINRRPDEVLNVLNRNKCFNREGGLDCLQAAKALGRNYQKSGRNPGVDCVGETNHFRRAGYPQHFFVVLDNSIHILDPLDGEEKVNPYNVVSYRLFGEA